MMSTMMKNNSINSDYEAKKLLNFSIKFSYSLLYNGAEVYRVEDSINRICKSFQNVKAVNTFALSNMVIISFVYNGTNYTSMRRLNDSGKNLEKIALLNELSRNIVSGKIDVDEAFKELKNIKNKSSYSNFSTILLITLSAPFLAFIFGGTLSDFIPASMAMLVEMLFLIYIGKLGLPSFLTTFLSACAVTLFIMTMSRLIHIENVSSIIIAGIIPLFPGIQITNSMRDILSGDILSGIIGIMSAIFTAVSIAVGVVLILRLFG